MCYCDVHFDPDGCFQAGAKETKTNRFPAGWRDVPKTIENKDVKGTAVDSGEVTEIITEGGQCR